MRRELFRRKSVEQILQESAREKSNSEPGASLRKTLRVRDLTAFGIAAIIGAGIFSTIGQAASQGGPAVSLLFVFVALACGFTAFCYAEFASMVPISGSAYTYAYASFGELVAWIIGWDLLLEYAIGNIAIAISWSDYFTALLTGFGVHVPSWMTMDFLTAWRGHNAVSALLGQGQSLAQILAERPDLKEAYDAWVSAPVLGSIHLVADLPALFITLFATWLVYIGVRESRNATNLLVAVKLAVIAAVLAVGVFYVDPRNWSNFMPNGIGGVLKGVAAVFWAFIGFDALATTAEECENSQRDIPRGIFYALILCTILYVLISFVLTGIVHYQDLNVGDPLAYIFKDRLPWFSGIIALSAVFAIGGVFLVFQYGQPRIWMSMSRDGLLPPVFSRIHPKYRTPSFSTVITGVLVAIPALFLNLKEVIELSSIGTLFAFVLVCGGVLVLDNSKTPPARPKFKTPYLDARYVLPPLYFAAVWIVFRYFRVEAWDPFFSLEPRTNERGVTEAGWALFQHKMPMLFFILAATALTILSFAKRLSLIPVLGLLSCLYLMTQLGTTNWTRFGVWLVIGLAIYFVYSRKSSKLAPARNSNTAAS
jgi:amino acid transporter